MAGKIQRPGNEYARRHFIGKTRQRAQRRFDVDCGFDPHARGARSIRQPVRRHRAAAIGYLHRDDVACQPGEIGEKGAGVLVGHHADDDHKGA